ncbi:MAG: Mut7-C RNAse domain-containing protein [Proteobacteria bacterium]|nr:Mut7-C RNAse domain-containing protein [Pseudomonadota bacterium]
MKFVCDAMLGKLARYLRMLGIDAPYIHNIEHLKSCKNEPEKPIFLTRRLIGSVPYDICFSIKSEHVEEQLREIRDLIKPFIHEDMLMSRCIRCNMPLDDVKKIEIEQFVPEHIFHNYDKFKACPSCKKVYWKGSHTEHMMGWIEKLLADN